MKPQSNENLIDRVVAWWRGLFGASSGSAGSAVDKTLSQRGSTDGGDTITNRASGLADQARESAGASAGSIKDRTETVTGNLREQASGLKRTLDETISGDEAATARGTEDASRETELGGDSGTEAGLPDTGTATGTGASHDEFSAGGYSGDSVSQSDVADAASGSTDNVPEFDPGDVTYTGSLDDQPTGSTYGNTGNYGSGNLGLGAKGSLGRWGDTADGAATAEGEDFSSSATEPEADSSLSSEASAGDSVAEQDSSTELDSVNASAADSGILTDQGAASGTYQGDAGGYASTDAQADTEPFEPVSGEGDHATQAASADVSTLATDYEDDSVRGVNDLGASELGSLESVESEEVDTEADDAGFHVTDENDPSLGLGGLDDDSSAGGIATDTGTEYGDDTDASVASASDMVSGEDDQTGSAGGDLASTGEPSTEALGLFGESDVQGTDLSYLDQHDDDLFDAQTSGTETVAGMSESATPDASPETVQAADEAASDLAATTWADQSDADSGDQTGFAPADTVTSDGGDGSELSASTLSTETSGSDAGSTETTTSDWDWGDASTGDTGTADTATASDAGSTTWIADDTGDEGEGTDVGDSGTFGDIGTAYADSGISFDTAEGGEEHSRVGEFQHDDSASTARDGETSDAAPSAWDDNGDAFDTGGDDAGDPLTTTLSYDETSGELTTSAVEGDSSATGDEVLVGSAGTAGITPAGSATATGGRIKGDGSGVCPPEYPIKGNGSSKIYHVPGLPSYRGTKAEWCFATEEDAINAGFRAPGGHRAAAGKKASGPDGDSGSGADGVETSSAMSTSEQSETSMGATSAGADDSISSATPDSIMADSDGSFAGDQGELENASINASDSMGGDVTSGASALAAEPGDVLHETSDEHQSSSTEAHAAEHEPGLDATDVDTSAGDMSAGDQAPGSTGSASTSAGEGYAGAVAGDGTRTCPDAYPIKGNASSMIYHAPGRSSYDATIAEWCFASTEAAEQAGFRAPKR